MNFKKASKFFITNALLGCILTNNCFAEYLESNLRYETFRDSNITVNDILEEQEVDIEVEGNSLVNIIDYKSTPTNNTAWTYKNNAGSINETTASGTFRRIDFGITKTIEVGKEYTLFVNITKNTMTNTSGNSSNVTKICFTQDSGAASSVYIRSKYTGMLKYVYRPTQKDRETPYISTLPNSVGEFAFENLMIIEGNHLDKDIDFFEGLVSAGELESNTFNGEVVSENIFDVNYFTDMIEKYYDSGNYGYQVKDGKNTVWVTQNHHKLHTISLLNNNYKFKENTQYIIKSTVFLDSANTTTYNGLRGEIIYTDGTSEVVFYADRQGAWNTQNVITNADKTVEKIIFSYGSGAAKCWIDLDSLYIGEYVEGKTTYNFNHNIEKFKIIMNQPLRSIPNRATDRIVKRNGSWYIERNCGEVTLNGSESWAVHGNLTSDTIAYFVLVNKHTKNTTQSMKTTNIISSRFNNVSREQLALDTSQEGLSYHANGGLESWYSVGIKKTKLSSVTLTEFKSYLSKNPIKMVYALDEPIYEPINVDFSTNLFPQTMHLYNVTKKIPFNLKVVVDRVANIAKEATELAISNSTVANISQARLWNNLMKDSTLKDSFQNQVNSITNVKDIGTIEPKELSVNSDIYITMQNKLSLSLDTNSIVFEDFDSTEALEKSEAIQLTVNSSLPYNIKASITNPIYNTDKSSTLDLSTINIKLSNTNTYKGFTAINTPITLLDNQNAGENNIHSIDLRLSSKNIPKVDTYKTSIKFEVEQK